MEHMLSFSIITLSAVVHASFQLSVSTLTLMSGHALGKKQSHARLTRLIGGFISGAMVMTILLVAAGLYSVSLITQGFVVPMIVWAAVCGALMGLGVAVWLFYFKQQGTVLWLPRKMAEYLATRCKKTKNSAEAFGLGLTSVFAELLFIGGPLTVSVLTMLVLPQDLQISAIALYVIISLLPLLWVGMLVQRGYKISHIQRWREHNKRFIQFASGTALMILGFYLYVNEIIIMGYGA